MLPKALKSYPKSKKSPNLVTLPLTLDSKQALSILTTYLTSSPISPLQQHFVELAQPLATDVDANILLNSEAAVTVDFENVPIDKMDLIDERFKSFMAAIMDKGNEFWDMDRIHTISE